MTVPKRDNKVSNDERIAVLENTCSHIITSLARIENNLALFHSRMDSRFSEIESRFRQLDSKIDEGLKNVNNRLWTLFFWNAAALVAVVGVMAHGFKWV